MRKAHCRLGIPLNRPQIYRQITRIIMLVFALDAPKYAHNGTACPCNTLASWEVGLRWRSVGDGRGVISGPRMRRAGAICFQCTSWDVNERIEIRS